MLPLLEPWAACPCCDASAARPLHVQRDKKSPLFTGPYYALLGCERCGVVYASPRPSEQAMLEFYSGGQEEDGWQLTVDRAREKQAQKQRLARKELAPLLARRGGDVLDIGCGSGALLDVLQDAGWTTTGIEAHTVRRIAATRHRLVDAIPAEPTFDAVILHHVLEHVLSPHGLLRAARAAARPGAILAVGVPSFEDLQETGNMPYACGSVHLNGFTWPALANAVGIAGWQVLDLPDAPTFRHRHLLFAAAAEPIAVQPGALPVALDVLRAYGRRLDKGGEFVSPDQNSATA